MPASALNRLQSELRRLYLPRVAAGDSAAATPPALVDARGMTRAMVLEIAARAGWEAVSRIWRGCQVELELPAPAIAVSGTDAFQLWFSLAEPLAAADAHAFLQALCAHFLAEVDARRLRLLPTADSAAAAGAVHAALVPTEQAQEERWSAFVAPDLAPLFSETPWLDIAPGSDGQADLLCRLASIGREAFAAAAARLRPAAPARRDYAGPAAPGEGATAPAQSALATTASAPTTGSDPRTFLLQVMRDETVALALRIEAAKALLHCADEVGPRLMTDPGPAIDLGPARR